MDSFLNHNAVIDVSFISSPISLDKKSISGRKKIVLTELEQDMIHYQFYLLLAFKEYPTTNMLLTRLHEEIPDFPIQSESTRFHHMNRLGFRYKATSKAPTPLDATRFVASHAKYFRPLADRRENNVVLYYHDETWLNVGEERHHVWSDGN
jgi:hypothetical protein